MDGFDDLLAPSRQALESNPFADLGHRSGSPDPWASPYADVHTSANAFGENSSASEVFSSDTYSNTHASPSTEEPTVDPLDSAHAATDEEEEEDNRPLGFRTPGFRESVSSFNETATIRPSEQEEIDPTISAPSLSPRKPSPIEPQTKVDASPPVQPPPLAQTWTSTASASTSAVISEFVSPLEQSGAANIERSIAGLSLGGEALGGWQSEQIAWGHNQSTSAFVSQTPADEDSDDDKPIRQTLKQQDHEDGPSERNNTLKVTRDDNGIQPIFVITVDDPQKVGDPIRSFTMYTVHTRTTSPLFQKSAFSVLRRYSDFLWLYETLSVNNPGVVVPPVPEKSPFGRFDDHFVRQRRFALEKCIQKTANHPILGKDPDLKMFLESDSFALDIKHRKAEIAHERGGLMATIGQTITGPRFYETDEWFDRQKAYLDSLESQLRGLVKAIELVAKHRAELATAAGEFAQTMSELSSSDVEKQLAQSLAGLADVERKIQDIQNSQSEQDMVTFMATVDEYTRLINSVRLAFSSRIRTYHAWKNSDGDLLRIKQTHERNRAQGRIPNDRLGQSSSQIAEAERRALDAKHEFDHVSKLVKTEVARFEQERIEDFKDSLHAFLEGMISRQKELIAAWENYQQMLLKRIGGGGQRVAS